MRAAASPSSTSVRYRSSNAGPPAASTTPTRRTASAARSPSPAGSNIVVNDGPATPSRRRRSSTSTSAWVSRSCSARAVSPTTLRHGPGSVVNRHGNTRPPAATYPVTTSRSPDNAARTTACAANSTAPDDTSGSRSGGTASCGMVTVHSPTPGTGSRVHRGITVDPPATSTFCQYSRPAFAGIPIRSLPPCLNRRHLSPSPVSPLVLLVDAVEVARGEVVVDRGDVVVVRGAVVPHVVEVARADVVADVVVVAVVARAVVRVEVEFGREIRRFTGAAVAVGFGATVDSTGGPGTGALDGAGVAGTATVGTGAATAGPNGVDIPVATAVPPDSASTISVPRAAGAANRRTRRAGS